MLSDKHCVASGLGFTESSSTTPRHIADGFTSESKPSSRGSAVTARGSSRSVRHRHSHQPRHKVMVVSHSCSPHVCPPNLDQIHVATMTLSEVLRCVSSAFRARKSGCRSRRPSFEGELPRALDRTVARYVFHDHVPTGNPASGLAAVNDWRRQGDEQEHKTARHILHDFRV